MGLFVFGTAITLLAVVAVSLWTRQPRPVSRAAAATNRRRASRVALVTPVFVYGRLADEPFAENTRTLNVSASGGLILLSAKVIPSQVLILTNLQTNEDLHCRVARSAKAAGGRTLAGLEFVKASPNYWQIDFVSNSPRHSAESKSLTSHHSSDSTVIEAAVW